MSNLSVVIPSKTMANLQPCVRAVHKYQPNARIIVIWDAPPSGDPGVKDLWEVQHLLDEGMTQGVVLRGQQPFVFGRNCNMGIRNSEDDDVVLLNDDAVLTSEGGFAKMQETGMDGGIGLVCATTNLAGNPAQHRQAEDGVRICGNCPGNSFPTVAYVCVLIPRRVVKTMILWEEQVVNMKPPLLLRHQRTQGGPLDERFVAYGWEDNDFSRRLFLAGYKIAIHDGCFVDHASLKPTFRAHPTIGADLQDGRQIYMAKWGSM